MPATLNPHTDAVAAAALSWYAANARDLPWRTPGTSPWGVLVSEVMAQQTPVARVAPQWLAWMQRWPTAADLAAATTAEVLTQWDRLGYPRRALRLHECARDLCRSHAGEVPDDYASLIALPGIGDYTAAAVLAFAFGRRALVMDTNVRRVHARVFAGLANHRPHITASERTSLDAATPEEPKAAAWSQAVMELGAVICRPQPRCADCPLVKHCSWHRAGQPVAATPARRPQSFAGTDRQVRGKVMALLRAANGSAVELPAIENLWHDHEQLHRALDSLVADGLAQKAGGGQFHLPAS